GLASVKPLPGKEPMVLQRLAQEQRVALTYRGSRVDALSLEAVVPRRVARDQASVVTVSARGLPANLNQVHLYVGGQALQIESVTREGDTAPAVLTVRSEEHTSELQSRENLVCRLLLEKKNKHRLSCRVVTESAVQQHGDIDI